jgi:hypothetical protein
MRRDMDLVRKMVLMIEDQPDGHAPRSFPIAGYTDAEIGYHTYLIAESGLCEGQEITTATSGVCYMLGKLTPAGHDFADAARSDTVWQKAKTKVQGSVGTVTVEVMKALLDHVARQMLKLG